MKEKILKLPLAVRIIAPIVVMGLCVGLGIGLYAGWRAWPVLLTNEDISNLKGSAQEDYIVLTAKNFANDRNLVSARTRLAKLNDPNITDRVGNLAMTFASQSNPESVQIARLAVALGSQNNDVALLAVPPEPVAMMVTPTVIDPPASVAATPTLSPTVVISAMRTPTRRITLTPTPTKPPAAVIPPTTFMPADTNLGWPGGFHVEPATVPVGQQFWHLVKAIYCDYPETQYGCSNKSGPPLPGGQGTIGVWVTLVGGKAPLILDPKPANELEDKSNDSNCQCTYTLDFPGPSIEVSGHPSDKILGAASTTAVRGGFPRAHVRYFFTYQLMTR